MTSLCAAVLPSRSLRPIGSKSVAIVSRSLLHTTSAHAATPLSHPAAPGPPPKPPLPAVTQPAERLARKKRQAELLQRGQELKTNPAKPGSALQKRFWKNVDVKETSDGYNIMLDTRPVRTASKSVLNVPLSKPQLAIGIAIEWDLLVTAQQALRQNYIPLTSLTSRALDIQHSDAQGEQRVRQQIVSMAMGYLRTDTLLCWVPEHNPNDYNLEQQPRGVQTLRALQEQTAQPIIDFLSTHIWPGVKLEPILDEDSIMPRAQPEMTTQIITGWVSGLPAYELAALERGILASKSLLVATRLMVEWSPAYRQSRGDLKGGQRFGIEEAAKACNLEVAWQTGVWGEVEDTHDVDKEDLRRQLGSVILLVTDTFR